MQGDRKLITMIIIIIIKEVITSVKITKNHLINKKIIIIMELHYNLGMKGVKEVKPQIQW